MIELKNYHFPNSTTIQATWQGDQWLLSKITKIAYKLLIENVGIFLYNQSAKVRNFFKPKKVEEKTPGSPHSQNTTPIPNYALAFSSTVQTALFGTLFWRGVKSLIGWSMPLREKAHNCGERASFQWINQIKQLELKNFALASCAIPFTINLVNSIRKEPKNLAFTTKVTNAVKKQLSAPHFLLFTSMISLALANPLYGRTLGLTSKDGFDSSGHLMLKTVLAPIVGTALSQTAADHPNFASIFGTVYSITDGIFLKNTTQYCHTALESLAGYVWGIGIIATSSLLTQSLIWINPPKTIKNGLAKLI